MGSSQTWGMAAFIADADDKDAALKTALGYQVGGNFYPPLPSVYADLGVEAVKACAAGQDLTTITLPDDLDPRPRAAYGPGDRYVNAADLVDALRAWPLVEAYSGEWADEDEED